MNCLLLYSLKTVGLGVLFITVLMLIDALSFDPDQNQEDIESKSHR